MGKKNDIMKAAGAVVVAPLINIAVDLAQKGIVAYIQNSNTKIKAGEAPVRVPEICDSDGSMKLEEAKCSFERLGFKVGIMAVEPKIKYRKYADMQVVGTKPKGNRKVAPGSYITIKYVTSEVIEESKKLFEESEKRKAEKRAEAKQTRRETVDKIKDGVIKAQKGVEKVIQKRIKNEDSKDNLI